MESRTKTPYEMLLINRLPKVTNHPVLESAGPDVVVGEGRHEDRRKRMPGFDEAPVELDTGHRRHMDISDHAGGFDETRGREDIGSRWENLDDIAQRPQEPSHGLAKELIIINDQDQWRFRHSASGSSYGRPNDVVARTYVSHSLRQSVPPRQCQAP
jgi:hypothetical protein